MENLLFKSLLVGLVSLVFLWGYWAVFYPAVMLKARFRIAAIQDGVRLLALRDRKLALTNAYFELEHFLLIARRVVQYHDIVGPHMYHPPADEMADIERRICSISAEPEIQLQFRELVRWMVVVRTISSPAYLCCEMVLASLSLFSDWARRLLEQKEKEAFTIDGRLPA